MSSMDDRAMNDNAMNVVGLALFVISGIFFLALGIQNADLLTIGGCVAWLVGCVFWAIPLWRDRHTKS